MKIKELMFPSSLSTTCFQVTSQSSNLRGTAGMHNPSMRSTMPVHLICPHIFHPHSLFFTRWPGTHLYSYNELQPLPLYSQCVHMSHLLHSIPQELEQNTESFSTSMRGCGARPGVEFITIPPNEILQLQEIYWRCQCSWASDPVVAPGSSSFFLLAATKAGWACGTEKLQVQTVFSHCNFLYRTFNSSAANSFTHWEDSKSWGYHNS